ncbi:MAG: peptidase M16 [Spirochaetaceae bacterium]|nr:MAG: peptidase M16 [Spirochaetaceae bacterium]
MTDNTRYVTLRTWDVPDFHGTGTLYRHRASNAQVFHLHNEDPENFFAFAFATLPEDSSGVAHILEHTVLCGSERFPLKDPFLQLLKGSVNTFLNALTYPDKTVYPAASPVRQDLFNMMKVYGDAVFHPQLRREMFAQEGHRLHFDEEGNLRITGVVYNEMKGNYSSHDSIAAEKCYQSLFPDTIYRHDSGGDPAAIPSLTWDRFSAFHNRYYHPANARIVLYGDIPAEEYLDFLDREFLRSFEKGRTYMVLEEQPRWEKPRLFETTFPAEGAEDLKRSSSVTLNWLLFPVTETRRLLAASVLAEVLVGHSGSPLTKALIDSGLGQDLSPVFGMEADLRDAVFSVGLRGTDPEHREAIEDLVIETLRKLAAEGLDRDLVEGALRRVEFRHRELKSGPNGIRAMNRVLRTWMYGGSPAAALRFSEDLASLRRRIDREPRFLETMIRTLLLENGHRSTVIVRPDPEQSRREQALLTEVLEHRAQRLSPRQREELERENAALEALQEEPDDPKALAKIPFLSLKDIPREVHRIPCETGELPGGATVYRHRVGTNGILYLDLAFDLDLLEPPQEALLNLLGGAFTEIGLPGLSFDLFNREMALRTGGISAFVTNQTHLKDLNRVRRLFILRLRVLARAWREGAQLFSRLLREIDFSDASRLHQILEEMTQDMIAALVPSGHYFAGLRAGMGLHGLVMLEETMNGITQLDHLREFQREEMPVLGSKLAALATDLLDPRRLTVNVTGDSAELDEMTGWLPELLADLRSRRKTTGKGSRGGSRAKKAIGVVVPPSGNGAVREYLLASAGVSYVAAAFPGVLFGEPLAPAQDVLAHMLRTGLLWEKIRMRGGAYGAFAHSRTAEGLFSFSSYRDPHSARTLEAYREALEELARTALPKSTLDLGKVSMLGRELRPLAPREAGFTSFRRHLFGIDDDLRQEARDLLRAVTPRAVKSAAALLLDRFADNSVAVLGGEAGLEELRRSGAEFTVRELGV